MTQSDDARDLPPEQDAVRRLLAEARHDEPVPPAVAARLDAVLEKLSADRREERATPVVDLAARRRRRGVGVALMAAAAVVVAGVGIGQVVGGLGSGGLDSGAGGGDSVASSESDDRSEGSVQEDSDGGAPTDLKRKEESSTLSGNPTYDLSSGSLRRDLRDARRSTADSPASALPEPCPPAEAPSVGDGRRVPVTLDGQPALALYRVPEGARQQVDVYLCGADVPVESVTLRAP